MPSLGVITAPAVGRTKTAEGGAFSMTKVTVEPLYSTLPERSVARE